jgi:hypothetical protein
MAFHVGDLATVRIDILENGSGVDVSGASVKQIKFRKPSGAVVTKTATSVSGDPSMIEYAFTAGELDEAGYWEAQPYLEGVAGWTGHGDITVEFEVAANL